MKVGMVSLGCSKNRVDAEIMLGLLRAAGHDPVADPAAAEVIVVNTCGFIEPAKRESVDAILEMAEHKRAGACRALIVAGCLSGRYRRDLAREMPEVDAFLAVGDVGRIVEAVETAASGAAFAPGSDIPAYVEGVGRILTSPPGSAYVKIADGCDNRCAYCAIPLIRGGLANRAMDAVVRECAALWEGGIREINLVAQDVTRWADGPKSLPDLIGALAEVSGGRWLRVLYAHPARVGGALLDALAQGRGVCAYLDVPIQHTHGAMLAAMGRGGGPEDIAAMVRAARHRGITLRTTVIVGFPGETDAMFDEMCDFLGAHPFDRLGAFAYSPEEGTAAYALGDPVPPEVKRARLERLMVLQAVRAEALNRRRIGARAEVLIEGRRRGHLYGRSAAEAPETDGVVRIETRQALAPGTLVRVRMTQAGPYDMIGALEEGGP